MMPRHPSVLLVSVIGHVTLLAALVVLSVFAPDALPVPRTLLAWSPVRTVHLDDIPLAPATAPVARTARRGPSSAAAHRPAPAPVVAQEGVSVDPGPAGEATRYTEPGASVVNGVVYSDGLGTLDTPAAPPPRAPVRLHSGIVSPVRVVHVAPAYPEIARQTRTQGIVIVEATIDERGNVAATQVLRSIPLLDRAALDAVRQWHFSPARLNGEAIAVIMTVTVNFTLAP